MTVSRHLIFLTTLCVALVSGARSDSAEIPRPEHPRPDLLRENWLSLNGEWQFEIDKEADGEARGLTYGTDLNAKIIVPFCPESKLSGLAIPTSIHMKHVWYRRLFDVPASMRGKRVRIHFGAVDYRAWVYINGQLAGSHVGGSAAFTFEITKFLHEGANEVVVKVLDDLSSGLQAGGKQSESDQSAGCFYTRTTGIWQPVWLEGVGSSFVENLRIVPDPDNSRVLVEATIVGPDGDLSLRAEALADGKVVGAETVAGASRVQLVLNLREKRLWRPGAPFLYDLTLTLRSGQTPIDELRSYFGLRSLSILGRRMLINGQPIFQRLILDQGFYPEGLWTAPSDAALKNDIELCQACGYNGARLHQKVFEPRFLYWADKLGYLVWGEFPNAGYHNQPAGFSAYVNEWTEILLRDRNHPSIVGWCAFNENFEASGELQQLVWRTTKGVDPTRPALEASGWTHTLPRPEVLDAHDYTGEPAVLRKRWLDYFAAPARGPFPPARYFNDSSVQADRGIPFMVSEIGGIGWATEGGWSYGQGPKTLDEFYTRYQGTIDAMLDNPNLFGFCYTQLTDIEQERNGLYFYDRKPKFDARRLREITARPAAYERGETLAPPPPPVKTIDAKWKVLVGAMQDGPLSRPYRYTTETPGDDWMQAKFDDSAWQTGLAPFARDGRGRTEWKSHEIHFRQNFEFAGGKLRHGAIVIGHNDRTEVYLNGQKILAVTGSRTYHLCLVTEEMNQALKPGTNTLAVHSHEGGEGEWVDLAVLAD